MPVAHKPGAIPLRPLVLSDIFDGAFRIIRYNPRATIGAAVLVSAVAMIVPIVAGLASGSTGGLSPDAGGDSLSDSQVVSLLVAAGGLLAGAQLQSIGLLFVSGMIAHVSSAAAVGRKLTMAEAWAATRGKRWRLLGMAFLLGLGVVAVVGVAIALVVLVAVGFQAPLGEVVLFSILVAAMLLVGYLWFWVRLRALAVPTLMLEPVGVFGALGRAVRLTRHQFWRILGLLLLVTLVVGVAGGILRLPFSIAGQVVPHRLGGRRTRPADLPAADRRRHDPLVGRAPAVHGRRVGPAVHRPADPQGGLRRRAARPGRGPARLMLAPGPPLQPSGDEGRRLLRDELVHGEYHRQHLLQRLIDWLWRHLQDGVGAASGSNGVTAFVTMLVAAALVVGLVLLLSRVRRDRRTRVRADAVLTGDRPPPTSCGGGRRPRSPRAATPTPWSTRSGRSPFARSSAAG